VCTEEKQVYDDVSPPEKREKQRQGHQPIASVRAYYSSPGDARWLMRGISDVLTYLYIITYAGINSLKEGNETVTSFDVTPVSKTLFVLPACVR
jgi:hypothetical protein